MSTTETTAKEDTDQPQGCDNDWCDGPTSETLPCFDCYDVNREYVVTTGDRRGTETTDGGMA
jgi:hypothetical protein